MLNLKKMRAVAALSFTILAGLSSSVHAQNDPWVIHVDIKNGTLSPPNFGLDGWSTNAHRFLQDAIAAAKDIFDTVEPPPDEVHIWIAAAFDESDPPKPIPYRPDQSKDFAACGEGPPSGTCCPPYGNCSWGSAFDAFIADQDVEALIECISAAGGGDVS